MTTSREEWARSWALPFVAAIGIAGATLFPFASSLLLVPLTRNFGWSRAQFSLSLIAAAEILFLRRRGYPVRQIRDRRGSEGRAWY